LLLRAKAALNDDLDLYFLYFDSISPKIQQGLQRLLCHAP
jgi:hypothetical protein